MSFDVGAPSRNDDGEAAAMKVMPSLRNIAKPTSCTIRSRAKRLAVSTITVRTPLPTIRASMSAKPGRLCTSSAPDTAKS